MIENSEEGITVGDTVRFTLEERDVYSYNVPLKGTVGLIEVQTHSVGLEQMLGVKIPMSVVKWEDGHKSAVFTHDLRKINLSTDSVESIKAMASYSGENNN